MTNLFYDNKIYKLYSRNKTIAFYLVFLGWTLYCLYPYSENLYQLCREYLEPLYNYIFIPMEWGKYTLKSMYWDFVNFKNIFLEIIPFNIPYFNEIHIWTKGDYMLVALYYSLFILYYKLFRDLMAVDLSDKYIKKPLKTIGYELFLFLFFIVICTVLYYIPKSIFLLRSESKHIFTHVIFFFYLFMSSAVTVALFFIGLTEHEKIREEKND